MMKIKKNFAASLIYFLYILFQLPLFTQETWKGGRRHLFL